MSDIQINFQDITVGSRAAKLITFTGQLDETNVDHEAKKVYQVIEEMPQPVLLLDFSGLEYMNSKSIGYVTDWFTQASSKSGSISIIAPKPNILDILKVVGITQIITVYSSLEEAKTALGSTNTPTSDDAAQPAVAQPVAAQPVAAQPAPQAPAAEGPAPTAPETTAQTAPAPAATTPEPATQAPVETPAEAVQTPVTPGVPPAAPATPTAPPTNPTATNPPATNPPAADTPVNPPAAS